MSPFEAQQELNALEAEAVAMKERHRLEFQPLKDRAILLTRIINGDDLHDAYFRAEQERERQRQIDITSGRDSIALAQQAAREEAAQRLLEEQARAAKNKVVADARWEAVERMARQTTILR